MPNLVLLAGLPGAGKSTYASTFFDLKYEIVSSDRIRQELAGSTRAAHDQGIRPWDAFYQRIEDCLRHDVDVVADATFLTRKHRARAQEVAERTGAKTHIVFFQNYLLAVERNQARPDETRVPDEAMHGMVELYFNTLADIPNESFATVTQIGAFQ